MNFLDTATLTLEVAWGADLTDIGGISWTWTDITADVRQSDDISVKTGRSDWMSTPSPSVFSCKLDNSSGQYLDSIMSSNWPNVRRNVPVRLRINVGGFNGVTTVFQGYADGFSPVREDDPKDPSKATSYALLNASGYLRRFSINDDPAASPLSRAIPALPNLVAYWTLEDGNTSTAGQATVGAYSAMFRQGTTAGLTLAGDIAWAGATDLTGSIREVVLTGRNAAPLLICRTDPGLSPGSTAWTLTWAGKMSSDSTQGANVLVTMGTRAGLYVDAKTVDVFFSNTNTFIIWDETGASVSVANAADLFDTWHYWTLRCIKSGTSVVLTLYKDGVSYVTQTIASVTMRAPSAVLFEAPFSDGNTLALGHAALFASDATADILALSDAAAGYPGELATDRMLRICDENSVPLDFYDPNSDGSNITMGPQTTNTVLALLQECADADGGILYDGQGVGLGYAVWAFQVNQALRWSLDASKFASLEPVQDDSTVKNRWTAQRTGGGAATVATDSGLTVDTVGDYPDNITLNIETDSGLADQAGWRAHLGSVPGYRVPSLDIEVQTLGTSDRNQFEIMLVGDRVQVKNVNAVWQKFFPEDTNYLLDLRVEGFQFSINRFTWHCQMNLSSYDPWQVIKLANDTGDVGGNCLDTDDSQVTSNITAGTTGTFSVTTNSGPVWTTLADDFPFYVDVGGIKVKISSITNSTSPQTFHIASGSSVPIAVAAGTPVQLWNPPVLGL